MTNAKDKKIIFKGKPPLRLLRKMYESLPHSATRLNRCILRAICTIVKAFPKQSNHFPLTGKASLLSCDRIRINILLAVRRVLAITAVAAGLHSDVAYNAELATT